MKIASILPSILLVASTVASPIIAQAGPVEDLGAVLINRAGNASEDRRSDKKFLGVRTGCPGDTVEADVSITGVSGYLEGDTAVLSVDYSGDYSRQGWGSPCERISSDLGGLEKRRISGTYNFRVTAKLFQRPIITWGQGSNYGEVSDPGHDSNVMAIRAVQNAISSAF